MGKIAQGIWTRKVFLWTGVFVLLPISFTCMGCGGDGWMWRLYPPVVIATVSAVCNSCMSGGAHLTEVEEDENQDS
jgi:hypothetical protein